MGKITAFLIIFFLLMMSPPSYARIKDGRYVSKNRMVDVAVTIEDGKITDIEILEHRGGGKKYEEMIMPLIDEMIEKQSTEIDAVTGATVSSDYLKQAVDDTLKQAGEPR